MSIKLQTQVLDCAPFKGTQLLVLLVLADQCGDDGRGCWSSVAYIADSARCDVRTAQRAFSAFEKAGWLRREIRPDSTSMYHVTPPEGATPMRRLRRGGDKMPGVTEPLETDSQAPDDPDIPAQEGAAPMSPGGDTHVTPVVTPMSPRTINEPSENLEEPFVSPEAAVDEKISDDEVTAEAQAPASPPQKPKGSALSRGEVVAPPARLDLLPEHYEHRAFMPDKEAFDEIRERFAGHDGTNEGFKLTLRGQTNAYIKWMEERKKAPYSRGWRDWMVRYYRRIIDQNLKALGVTLSDYSPSELTQEEREAMANEVRNAADQMEGGPDDPGR